MKPREKKEPRARRGDSNPRSGTQISGPRPPLPPGTNRAAGSFSWPGYMKTKAEDRKDAARQRATRPHTRETPRAWPKKRAQTVSARARALHSPHGGELASPAAGNVCLVTPVFLKTLDREALPRVGYLSFISGLSQLYLRVISGYLRVISRRSTSL